MFNLLHVSLFLLGSITIEFEIDAFLPNIDFFAEYVHGPIRIKFIEKTKILLVISSSFACTIFSFTCVSMIVVSFV